MNTSAQPPADLPADIAPAARDHIKNVVIPQLRTLAAGVANPDSALIFASAADNWHADLFAAYPQLEGMPVEVVADRLGTNRNNIYKIVHDARRKLQFDLYYVKNNSLVLDTLILAETVRVVLFGEGAH